MSSIAIKVAAAYRPSVIGKIFSAIRERIQSYLKASTITQELTSMSDRALADMGIVRGDIQAIAHGTYQRTNS